MDTFMEVAGRYRHLITIVVGLLFVCVLSDTSFRVLLKLDATKKSLEEELLDYQNKKKAAERQLEELQRNGEAVRRVAREMYLMKYDDEDVFVFKDDVTENDNNDHAGE